MVASLQVVAKHVAALPLPTLTLRQLLRDTGTPQSGELNRPIGPMPDLRAAIEQMP